MWTYNVIENKIGIIIGLSSVIGRISQVVFCLFRALTSALMFHTCWKDANVDGCFQWTITLTLHSMLMDTPNKAKQLYSHLYKEMDVCGTVDKEFVSQS